MAQTAFALHLGGGLYLDSDGTLVQGSPDPATPVYEAPFKLPIDPASARQAMEGVQKAFKDVNKDPEVLKKFEEYGFDTEVLDLLSVIAKIAGIVAPVLAVLSFAYDVAKLLGAFKEGPSALELLVQQRFDELESNVESVKVLIQTKDLRDGRIAVEGFTDDVRAYVAQLENTNPSIEQLEADRNRLLALHNQKADGVATLLDQTTWLANFDRDEHKNVWPTMLSSLHTLPMPSGPPQQAVYPADGGLAFDHRLMVPLASFAAESYLACIRGITPEHRSSGEFRQRLRTMANKLDDLAQQMRSQCLAVTHYTPEDFAPPFQVPVYDVVVIGSVAQISPQCSRWPVGALDLRYHGDRFFGAFLAGLTQADVTGAQHPTKLGGMDLRWRPPAILEPGSFGNYLITNPEECAAAANAQAMKDYADLLSLSGYTELLRLAALFRSESTEPDRSQTVSAGGPQIRREAQPRTPVTVSSQPIVLTGVITSTASRERAQCTATVLMGTQPLKRARPAEYRVVLRTLDSVSSTGHWRNPLYEDYRHARYVRDPNDRKFLMMDIFENDMALDDAELVTSASPRTPLVRSGSATLDADTFDWFIPVRPPFKLQTDFDDTLFELRAYGWTGSTAAGQPLMGAMPAQRVLRPALQLVSDIDLVGPGRGDDAMADWTGQARDPKREQVTIAYDLRWNADRLEVQLRSDPVDRNFVVFLVLEEKLGGTGNVLHTAIPIPVNGQYTYVPQQFFDEEEDAIDFANRVLTDFNNRYALQAEPGPFDPVVGWVRPGDYHRLDSLRRMLELAREHAPQLLERVLRDYAG